MEELPLVGAGEGPGCQLSCPVQNTIQSRPSLKASQSPEGDTLVSTGPHVAQLASSSSWRSFLHSFLIQLMQVQGSWLPCLRLHLSSVRQSSYLSSRPLYTLDFLYPNLPAHTADSPGPAPYLDFLLLFWTGVFYPLCRN